MNDGVGAVSTMAGVCFEPHDVVRIGLVGAGGRARTLVASMQPLAGIELVAMVEPSSASIRAMRTHLADQGYRDLEFVGPDKLDEFLAREDLDLIMVTGPWETHAPVAAAAMRAGKHVAIEVPAATTLDECWELVETSESTRRHCMILENCCYGSAELSMLQLVRRGVLGELVHGEAAYIHDLRHHLMRNEWRRQWHTRVDGNLYPTHGLSIISAYMDITRGDRFTSLVSMSSKSTSAIADWAATHDVDVVGEPASEQYVAGDINTSILATELGRTVVLQHQVIGPRPYSRGNVIVGTNGVFSGYPPRIYLEDRHGLDGFPPEAELTHGPDGHVREEYVDLSRLGPDIEHELWRTEGELARSVGGHGGMDYLMMLRLIRAMREGLPPDMDVYDAATWSAPLALSVASVERGGAPVDFPDFLRGGWRVQRQGLP